MAHDPQGFLKYDRVDTPKRPTAERVRDWQPIYLRSRDEATLAAHTLATIKAHVASGDTWWG